MTRGRRKDITLPPSRSLIIQRAYRDRKSKHLADLEERCRKAEEENERLRKELELARSESAAASTHIELARACSDLMQNLERTQKALSLFQQRALGDDAAPPGPPESKDVVPSTTELDIAAILAHSLRQQDLTGSASQQPQFGNTRQSPGSAFSPGDDDLESCCGGVLDCSSLAE